MGMDLGPEGAVSPHIAHSASSCCRARRERVGSERVPYLLESRY